jgi:hypothetical protein
MTPEAKGALAKTIRVLRERLLADLDDAMLRTYKLGTASAKAQLSDLQSRRRARLETWVDEQVRAEGKATKHEKRSDAAERFRHAVVKRAAYTLLNRMVYLRLLEASGLRKVPLVTGGWSARGYQDFRDLAPDLTGDETEGYAHLLGLVFDELALDLPGLYGSAGIADLVPTPASTLRHLIETLDDPQLESCWTDDMTLGWVYQYWNDPEREALDAKLNAGGKVEPHEIASKTQMFTERYMVDWLLQNTLGPMWLAVCQKHGWTPQAQADGVLDELEQRRMEWRAKREAGEVALTELMPLHSESERRWAYYVPQPIPGDAVTSAPATIRDLKLLDPAVGSGHFLVVAMDLLAALYREEAQHRGEASAPQWQPAAIVERILSHNLHGIDLDPRAVQIAAAALWLKARQLAPDAEPVRMNLVAPELKLASLPDDDPALVALRAQVERETGIPAKLTDTIVHALKGADHLGSLLKVDGAVDEAIAKLGGSLAKTVHEQGKLFEGFSAEPQKLKLDAEAAKAALLVQLEGFLARHSSSEDLGLRLRGEQLAAGVRFLRVAKVGTYDVVVGNPPYQGTSKMSDAKYVAKEYALGKADLYAAFLLRGLQLAREGGVSALLTMRNWMFIKQYAGLREFLLGQRALVALLDLEDGAFEEIGGAVVNVCGSVFRGSGTHASQSVALRPTEAESSEGRSGNRTARKRAAVLCHVGRHEFAPAALKVVPSAPLAYWWPQTFLGTYSDLPKFGARFPSRAGMATQDNPRYLRRPWEVGRVVFEPVGWAPLIKGGAGREWIEPVSDVVEWHRAGLQMKVRHEFAYHSTSKYIPSERFYFSSGVAFCTTGAVFSARAYLFPAIFTNVASTLFAGEDSPSVVCQLNSRRAREFLADLNPSIHFELSDVARLAFQPITGASRVFNQLRDAFDLHESHREASLHYSAPGPSPWRYAQYWAQAAVDRSESTLLPEYTVHFDPEPPTDHISFALGVALGRFGPNGEGILDPTTANLDHALPHGVLFLDATRDADDHRDGLGHPAAAPLHAAWDEYGPRIDTKRKHLRDYLRLDFFSSVHKGMYENRPIHWPLSSEKKTFVAWINIHRWHAGTLKHLLAEYLVSRLGCLEGQLSDLRATRDSGDAKASREAEKTLDKLVKARDELAKFIVDVQQCAEKGPKPPDAKTPAREVDAPYEPDLDDGVMINSAALYPLLEPQWKDPRKWWTELAAAQGRKDYDWSHLAMRYWPTRVDAKCKEDPSLAVAHHCFWRYHPVKAYAWELRLQDEIEPQFTIDEPDSDQHRAQFLAEHPDEAAEILAKELKRLERKAQKAADGDETEDETEDESDGEDVDHGPLFDQGDDA